MPHSPLVSKIRCHSPNKTSSRVCNRNYLVYIGTREGVDLSHVDYLDRSIEESKMESLSDDSISSAAANDLYLKYISERPGSNGLFGNFDVSDPIKVGNMLADLTAQGRNIYRGIVSLSEEDALELGYTDKEKWVQFIRSTIPDVAKEFNIDIDKLQWSAAVHMEKRHPHCHYMLWSTSPKIGSPFIHPSKQNKIRELMSKEMFKEERELAVIDKTLKRDAILDGIKDLVLEDMTTISKKNRQTAPIMDHVSNDTLSDYGKKLCELTSTLPGGRLSYKLLPPDSKKAVDLLVDEFIQSKIILKEYNAYMDTVDKLSKTYSASPSHTATNKNIANEDIRKRIANIILKNCSQIRKESSLLEEYASQAVKRSENVPDNSPIDSLYPDLDHEDVSIKVQLLEKEVASSQNPYAYFQLGKLYSDPESHLYNMELALNYLKQAAKQDNKYALAKLGNIFLWGNYPGIKKSEKLGLKYLKQAAYLGNKYAHQSIKFYEEMNQLKQKNFLVRCGYQCTKGVFSMLFSEHHEQYNYLNYKGFRSRSLEALKAEMTRQGKHIDRC